MDKPCLLIVDDHTDTLEMFSVILAPRYRVVTCTSAAEAFACLDEVGPDVLVLDIGMTPVNGVDCLEKIRAVARYATVPAIALTGWARPGDRKRFLEAGFQAVLIKPVLDDPLVETVERLLARPGGARPLTAQETSGTMAVHGNGSVPARGAA